MLANFIEFKYMLELANLRIYCQVFVAYFMAFGGDGQILFYLTFLVVLYNVGLGLCLRDARSAILKI